MGVSTSIAWTDHTFNPWIGCSKVHTGCLHCYAEADMDKRRGRAKWGASGTRSRTSDAYWREPLKWNRDAEKEGIRRRVFCASLADVFEDWSGPIEAANKSLCYWCERCKEKSAGLDTTTCLCGRPLRLATMSDIREMLFSLIDRTPSLDWLLLSKRPENIRRMWPVKADREPVFLGMPGPLGEPIPCVVSQARRSNVWLGTSVSDQETAERAIPELLKCRDLTTVLFLSVEPLLAPVELSKWLPGDVPDGFHSKDGWVIGCEEAEDEISMWREHVDWLIVGGESGPNARMCSVRWVHDIVNQCRIAGVSCFVKQLGSYAIDANIGWPDGTDMPSIGGRVQFLDNKGGNPAEWPEKLRVREFPEVSR